jgi:hypothetical protein
MHGCDGRLVVGSGEKGEVSNESTSALLEERSHCLYIHHNDYESYKGVAALVLPCEHDLMYLF